MPRKSAKAHREYQREYIKRPGKMAEHYARVDRYVAANDAMIAEARKGGCVDCGENHPAVLDFHHRDPKKKSFTIGARRGRYIAADRLAEELVKCDVRCSNCHRKLHWEKRNATHT